MKFILALFLCYINGIPSDASQHLNTPDFPLPEVGKKCPDFTLRNIEYYSIKKASLRDFRGKWLILDFWNKNCGACVASFPKTNLLNQQYKDRVQFMLVGYEDPENQIRPIYAKFREKEKLTLPCAFDSTLMKKWDIYAGPHIIVIDPAGVVRGITVKLSSENIDDFLSGKIPDLIKLAGDNTRVKYDWREPFLIYGNGGSDTNFLYRSLLTVWDHTMDVVINPIDESVAIRSNKVQNLCETLKNLYANAFIGHHYRWAWWDTAYYNTYWRAPILEMTDSSLFDSDVAKVKNLYCYSLIVPPSKANKETFQRIMQNDLNSYFGYKVRMETRNFPCWNLVVEDKAITQNLRTEHSDTSYQKVSHINFKGINIPVKKLVYFFSHQFGHDLRPFIDSTGIQYNIDIEMSNIIMSNWEDVQIELRKHGLYFKEGTIPLKVLVISDK